MTNRMAHKTVQGLNGRLTSRRDLRAARRLLFVCGGNTSRSPMAAAIARAELAAAGGDTLPWTIDSAGTSVRTPGEPISLGAMTALLELGVDVPLDHYSRQLTPDVCADTEAVYCMTRAQRDAVIALAPHAAERTICLDPDGDIPDPSRQPINDYRACASRLRAVIRTRLRAAIFMR